MVTISQFVTYIERPEYFCCWSQPKFQECWYWDPLSQCHHEGWWLYWCSGGCDRCGQCWYCGPIRYRNEQQEEYIKCYLVSQIPLNLMPGIPIDSQLMVDLLQSSLHLVLAWLDVVHLSHQAVLNSIIDQINAFPPLPALLNLKTIIGFVNALPVVDALSIDSHGSLSLSQSSLKILPSGLKVMSLIDISLQLWLKFWSPEGLQWNF